MNSNIQVNDNMSFKDAHGNKHGLRGHVTVWQEDPVTKERKLWDEDDNIIPISGYQWILMKMFDLYLDSSHKIPYENITQDTTVEIPDLNKSSSLMIGTDPSDYTQIDTNIPESHFIQGFMVGNGAASEDAITAKNTDYSFVKLRNPIPFRQTQSSETLDPSIASNYLGVYRGTGTSSAKSYYIKKFNDTPHIFHSWWKNGQSWDYIDPVTIDDLGPDSANGSGKTNRIESYVSCSLTLSADDCVTFFQNEGNTQSAVINELGLVAFDVIGGENTIMRKLYNPYIKRFIEIIFSEETPDTGELYRLAERILPVLTEFFHTYSESHIQAFRETVQLIKSYIDAERTIDFDAVKDALSSDDNIGVVAYYNQKGIYVYSEDKFITYLNTIAFSDNDEAQRIKLITYYTFKSIPIQSNTNWIFDYRIYAN